MNLQEQHERYALYLLGRSRDYVADSLEAHEHSDGRDLLEEIDEALAAGSGTAETSETSAQCEASQSGPKGNAQPQSGTPT